MRQGRTLSSEKDVECDRGLRPQVHCTLALRRTKYEIKVDDSRGREMKKEREKKWRSSCKTKNKPPWNSTHTRCYWIRISMKRPIKCSSIIPKTTPILISRLSLHVFHCIFLANSFSHYSSWRDVTIVGAWYEVAKISAVQTGREEHAE